MNIKPTNNISFGYSKLANEKLKKRLDESKQTPVIQSVRKAQNFCIFLENEIESLEGKNYRNVEKNEFQINTLSRCLIDTKRALVEWVDNLFPDLNFSKAECDEYDYAQTKEHADLNSQFYDVYDQMWANNKAFHWREDMRRELENHIDNIVKNDDDYKPTASVLGKEAQRTSPENRSGENLVTKFEPFSYSPKSLDEVVGIEDIKQDIEDLIIYPIQNPEGATKREKDYGIKSPNFILLYGPPGCGKTMLAEAVSNYTGCDMYKIDLSNIGSSYVNETASNIKRAFEYVEQEAQTSDRPVLVFMDEMDSILSKRSGTSSGSREDNKVINTLLPIISSLDDNNKNIILIGATNMFDALDPAAKSRADVKHYIGLPNEDEIKKLLSMHLKKLGKGKNLAKDDKALKEIAHEFRGYSPRDIVQIIKASGRLAFRHGGDITKEDFIRSLKNTSFEKTDEEKYKPKNEKRAKIGFAN